MKNKENHKKVKEIFDKIDYFDNNFKFDWEYFLEEKIWESDRIINLNEILFKQSFIDNYRLKYLDVYDSESCFERDMLLLITRNMENPVQYLYNLLFSLEKNAK